MTQIVTRHIPADVIRQLRENARDRCCLQGHIISSDTILEGIETETLHMHHIIFFSDGGENTEKNLMLVCPNCHAKIHRKPDLYPLEKLKVAKRHWTAMTKLIPENLAFETENDGFVSDEKIEVLFLVESFNLSYRILTPRSLSIRELAQYISNWILRPLAFYSRTSPYPSPFAKSRTSNTTLALRSSPSVALPDDLLLETISQDELVLIARVDIEVAFQIRQPDEEEKNLVLETVTLKWGDKPKDLDLHFMIQYENKNEQIWYRKLGTLKEFPWAKLSGDVTTGYGPEILSFGLLASGRYTVAVHNFSNEISLTESDAFITLVLRGKSHLFHCPREGSGRWWLVLEMDVETGELKEINTLTDHIGNITNPGWVR
jgi:hypothetical protein